MLNFKEAEGKIAEQLGYDSMKAFVEDYVSKGYTITYMIDYINQTLGTNISYSSFYKHTREFFPKNFNKGFRFIKDREGLAKKKGFSSFKEMIDSFIERKLNYKEMATELGLKHPITADYLEKVYGKTNPLDAEAKKDGFVDQARYRQWLKIANDLGYKTVRAAFKDFVKKKMPAHKQAEYFQSTVQSVYKRKKRIEEKNNQK